MIARKARSYRWEPALPATASPIARKARSYIALMDSYPA